MPASGLAELSESIRKLLTYDARPGGPLFGADGPLFFAMPWAAAFHQAGRDLRTAADSGMLDRGTRNILAYHVIFHWNRLGLSTMTQSILANVAEAIILESPAHATGRHRVRP